MAKAISRAIFKVKLYLAFAPLAAVISKLLNEKLCVILTASLNQQKLDSFQSKIYFLKNHSFPETLTEPSYALV